jgi:hypothetical protein
MTGDTTRDRTALPTTVGSLLGLVFGLGCCLGAGPRSGWVGGLSLVLGAVLVGLGARGLARTLLALVQASQPGSTGVRRAERMFRLLVAREPLRQQDPSAQPYDPATGAGVGEFLVEPRDLVPETVGEEDGIAHLLRRFRRATDPEQQQVLDRMLRYLEVDARTGTTLDPDELVTLRVRRRELAEVGIEDLLPEREPPHLAIGAVLLLGTLAVCVLVALGYQATPILAVALGTGVVAAALAAEWDWSW